MAGRSRDTPIHCSFTEPSRARLEPARGIGPWQHRCQAASANSVCLVALGLPSVHFIVELRPNRLADSAPAAPWPPEEHGVRNKYTTVATLTTPSSLRMVRDVMNYLNYLNSFYLNFD